MKTRLSVLMADAMPTKPERFGSFVKAELGKYQAVLKTSWAWTD